jgi:hypothetical protein
MKFNHKLGVVAVLAFLACLPLRGADKYDTRLQDLKIRLEQGQLSKSDYELEAREVLQEQAAMKSFETCILNLTLMDNAKQLWALEKKKTGEDTPTDADLFGQDKTLRAKLVCPEGGTYILGLLAKKPVCSVKGHDLAVIAKWEQASGAINQRICLQNLRRIATAKDGWASDNKKDKSDTPTEEDLVGPGKALKQKPACPDRGAYSLGKVSDDPTCSVPGHSLKDREVVRELPVELLPEAVQKIILKSDSRNACINNLRQLDGGKEQWALENRRTQNDTPTDWDLFGTDKYIKVKPRCPGGGTYFLNDMSQPPQCTIPGHSLPR